MTNEDFDWRIEDMGHVAEGQLAGRRLLLMSVANHPKLGTLSFITPNPAALALNIAINAAAMAETLRPRLSTTEVVEPSGDRGFAIRNDRLVDLYTFFEQSMIAVTMSFQALEVFANAIIGRRGKGKFRVKRKKKTIELTPEDAERKLSTEEKFAQVLPELMKVSNLCGMAVWQRFKQLKAWRDDTVHWKSGDVYSNYQRLHLPTLFFEFLDTDARRYPKTAMEVLRHFYSAKSPRWLEEAKKLLAKYDTLDRGS